jgi:Zn finger protein HypA/HybF involved in hydrogenase expression
MGLWSRFFHRRVGADAPAATAVEAEKGEDSKTVELPSEPFVFECRSCGKVFEARRKRPQCPECDGTDIDLMSG